MFKVSSCVPYVTIGVLLPAYRLTLPLWCLRPVAEGGITLISASVSTRKRKPITESVMTRVVDQ